MAGRRSQPRSKTRSRSFDYRWLLGVAMLAAGVWWLRAPAAGDATRAEASASAFALQSPSSSSPTQAVPVFGYRVINTFPHDPQAFTQGLIYRDGFLYESTGLNGQSSLRKVRLETGEVLQRQAIDARYFAEGLTDWGGHLLQLTWQANLGFVYDINTFERVRTFDYPGDGWGLTHDGTRLILSDGTDQLRFLDPATYGEIGRVAVRAAGARVDQINELEFVRGEVLANIWQSDRIARIAPATGLVTGWVDLTGLLPATERSSVDAVLNGIAWDAQANRLFVTGKHWPKLFEIEITPPPARR
jgi:glutamine cyclotransferase